MDWVKDSLSNKGKNKQKENEKPKVKDCFPRPPKPQQLASSDHWLKTHTDAQVSDTIDAWFAPSSTIGITDNQLIVYGYITDAKHRADVVTTCKVQTILWFKNLTCTLLL